MTLTDQNAQGGQTGPIIPRLPSLLASYQRKYNTPQQYDPTGVLAPALANADPKALSALNRLDLARVAKGQSPIATTQSALGLRAATDRAFITPEPDQPFFTDAITDITDIAKSIPKLPITIFNEAKQLPTSLGQVGAEFARGGGGIEGLGNVANLPGLRLVPGSFIAGQFGTGGAGVGGLLDHPIYTALDVAPFASKALRATPTVKRVTLANESQAAALGRPTPKPPRPIPTFLRNVGGRNVDVPDLRAALIDQQITPKRGWGDLAVPEKVGGRREAPTPVQGTIAVPNAYGQQLGRLGATYRRTAVGRYTTEAFGGRSRAATERGAYWSSYITNPDRAKALDPVAGQVLLDADRLGQQLIDDKLLTPERHAALYDALVHGDVDLSIGPDGATTATSRGFLGTMTPEETAWLSKIQEGQTLIEEALARRGDLVKVQFPHGSEMYDAKRGNQILNMRHMRDVAQWMEGRLTEHQTGQFGDVAGYWNEIAQILDDPKLNYKQRQRAVEMNLKAIERQGVDVAAYRKQWAKAQSKQHQANWRSTVYDQTRPGDIARLPRNPINSTIIDDALTITRNNTAGPLSRDLFSQLKANRWDDANRTVTKMSGTKRYQDLGIDFRELQRALDDRMWVEGGSYYHASLADRLAGVTERAKTATERTARVEAASPPARWDDLIRQQARAQTQHTLREAVADPHQRSSFALDPDNLDSALDAIAQDMYTVAGDIIGNRGFVENTIKQFRSDAQRSWLKLAEMGLEPKYVHRVSHTRAARMFHPQVFDNGALSISQIKERLWEPAASVPNLAISLQHQAYDILNKEASARFANEIGSWFGTTAAELQARYEAAAKLTWDADKSLSRASYRQQLIERDYTLYDPDAFLRGKGEPPRQVDAGNQIYIPKEVAATLERLRPILPSTLERATAPLMGVFRTTLLPLSPRWHLYNLVGGAVMVTSQGGIGVWKHLKAARELAREQGKGLGEIELPGYGAMPPGGAMRRSAEWMQEQRPNQARRLSTAQQVAAGHTLGRLLAQVRSNETVMRGVDAASGGIQKLYDANQFVDNMYRSMAYLSGYDKALSKGLSQADAIKQGMDLSRDILQSWDRLTPIERAGMRMVMPFYGWLAHLLKFTVKTFPADHPWRMDIMARAADTEINDYATGLPQRFQSLFMPFGEDAEGNTTAINLDGANPFRDVGTYAMLAGFMLGQKGGNVSALTSSLNPLIAAPLKAAGLDVSKGVPELYPEMQYDATTGQLTVAPTESMPLAFLTSVLPPARALTMLSGRNAEFRELMRTNPQAAMAQLKSSVGMPVLTKNVNMPEEIIKGEITRYEDMVETKNTALRTGDLGLMDRYPALRTYKTQIQQLQASGQLDAQMPGVAMQQPEGPSIAELLMGLNPVGTQQRVTPALSPAS